MRFLCLPGAYGSAEKFKVQLAPLVNELTSDKSATFHFIQGPCQAQPPEGYEEYFGAAPWHRFIEPDNPDEENTTDILERIRNFPDADTPEEQMRLLMSGAVSESRRSTVEAIEYLYRVMEDEGPFEGIIGYSEGATIAATLLLHEQRRFEEKGIPTMFKLAVFFAGWPPMSPELDGMVLSDETDLTINIPSIHIIGSLDPYVAGSMCLFNCCDQDTAVLFDHAKGHTLPRDKDTIKELGDDIRRMMNNARSVGVGWQMSKL